MTLLHVLEAVASAVVIGVGSMVYRHLRTRAVLERQRDAKLDRILIAFEGQDADPLSGSPATVGIQQQISTLRVRQEEIAATAQNAADDVTAVRTELTRNGGSSTKDAAYQAARSAEAAAASAELAARTAARTEMLLHRHMANGRDIMAVGLANDAKFTRAFADLGVELHLQDYPDVDTGG